MDLDGDAPSLPFHQSGVLTVILQVLIPFSMLHNQYSIACPRVALGSMPLWEARLTTSSYTPWSGYLAFHQELDDVQYCPRSTITSQRIPYLGWFPVTRMLSVFSFDSYSKFTFLSYTVHPENLVKVWGASKVFGRYQA